MDHSRLFRSKVKWLSLFLSVLVVFIHSTNTAGKSPELLALHVENFITGNLAAAAVPMFYAMSAFLFYQNFDFSKLIGKYRSRFHSLLIPFLFWNTIYMFVFYFLSRLPFINEAPFALTLPNVFDGVFRNKYNGAYWFMQELILFTILAPVVYVLMRNRFIAWVTYIGLMVVYGLGCSEILRVDIASVLFYLLGAYCGIHHRGQIMEANRFRWIGPAAFVLSQIVFYGGFLEINPLFAWLHIVLVMLAAFFCVNLITKWEVPEKLQCSFEVYTLHILILETFNKLFGYILPQDSNWILLDYFLSPLLTISIVVCVTQFIKRYLPRFHRFAFGGR